MRLLIGYGSQLHSDDGAGQAVALSLQKEMPELQILTGVQLLPEWAENISRADLVVFTDASAAIEAGRIVCFSLDAAVPSQPICMSEAPGATPARPAMTHYCTPQSLLELTEVLYGHRPEAWLYLIGSDNLSLGENFSRTLLKSMPALQEALRLKLSEV